jgi:hypothetical protein
MCIGEEALPLLAAKEPIMSVRILLAAGLILGLSATTRADDALNKQQLKNQKLIADAKQALYEATILERANPKKARDMLQASLRQLEQADLNEQKALIGQLKTRISQLDARVGADAETAQKIIDQGLRDKEKREAFKVRTAPSMQDVAAGANRFIGNVKDRLGSHERYRKLQSDGFLDIQNEMFKDAFKGEDRVPARYLWALENRVNEKLTKEEKSILKVLNSVLSVDWDKKPLKEALEYLSEKTETNILVNVNGLKEKIENYEDEKVTLKGKKLTIRTILKQILGERGLAYIIKEGNIHVLTAEQARETMTVRVYPVADLVSPDARFGPFIGQQMLIQNVNSLIQMIQATVDPQIWQQGATIVYEPSTRSLVIRAPAELHLQMGLGGRPR